MESLIPNLLLVTRQVAVLFALMTVGFACNKARLFGETAVKGMTNLLVIVVTPCLIIHSFQRPYDSSMLMGLGVAFAISLAVHVLGMLAGCMLRGGGERTLPTLRFAVLFSNAGFMGIPLEQAVLGTEGVFFGAVYVAVFNVFCWSYGLVMMSGDRRALRLKGIVTNPGLLGIVVALPLFFCSYTLPEVVGTPIRMLADLNTPVAMVVIGYYLAEADFRAAVRSVGAWVVAALRLLVIPGATLGGLVLLARFCPLPPKMLEAMVIAVSAPVAALTTVFSVKFNRDIPLSVGLVAGTTLLSILTMPPLVALAITLFAD